MDSPTTPEPSRIESDPSQGIVGGHELARLLGFPSTAAMTKADNRGSLPVTIFRVPDRRGRFAMRADVIAWVRSLQPGTSHAPPADTDTDTTDSC